MNSHKDRIQDQFTRQARLFQTSHRSAEDAIRQAVAVSGVTDRDTVLDVACGPGVLACAFARYARHVTGIDITPSMLEQARQLQATSGISNVTWRNGDVAEMPFADNRFSMVISRYAFHHFEDPARVLKEMVRVCAPNGKVVVIDSAPPENKAQAFNEIELERDPSHTRALTSGEISDIMISQGLAVENRHLYAWEVTAESLLARSFPSDGDREAIFRKYEADVGKDRLAMNTRYVNGVLHVTFPTLITVGRKQEGSNGEHF
ncbi:MAG: class I SAM-dependent methyltransferase [Desulfobacterales bacterium]